jgi:hypothetical protein
MPVPVQIGSTTHPEAAREFEFGGEDFKSVDMLQILPRVRHLQVRQQRRSDAPAS